MWIELDGKRASVREHMLSMSSSNRCTGFDNAGIADAIDAGAIPNLLPALSVYLKVFAKERFPKLSMF